MERTQPAAERPEQDRRSAAFCRIEGVLVSRPTIAAAGYLAANAQGLGARALRIGNVALAAPLALAGHRAGATSTRATWMGVRGMGEDRLVELGREYYERFVEPNLLDVGVELLGRCKKRGQRIVLLSDNLDLVIGPLGERLGADELVCNRLEFRGGEATGRLRDPVVGTHLAGQWARQFAERRQIDLGSSSAYGAQASDSLLLSAIGQPCAVNPDRWLRRIARDQSWPVVNG